MKRKNLRLPCGSALDSAIGPLFLLVLLVVSSFTSIVTELDAWRQVSSVAESIFIMIARPAAFDAVVESSTEVLEYQDIPVKSALATLFDDAQTARPGIGVMNSIRTEPHPRQIHNSRAVRPRGPPASG